MAQWGKEPGHLWPETPCREATPCLTYVPRDEGPISPVPGTFVWHSELHATSQRLETFHLLSV